MNGIKSLFCKGILLLAICAATGTARAQFNYNSGLQQYGDLLICFRPSTETYDLVVDVGSVTNFTSLAVGSHIVINPTYYDSAKLAYTGTNSIYWSALACQRLPGANSTNNIWVTRARSSLNTQSTPWPCNTPGQQGSAASRIDIIGNDALDISQGGDPNGASPTNGNTFVVERYGNSSGDFYDSYGYLVGANGNLGGNFWGDSGGVSVEQSTPSNFTTAGQPVRADFYQLLSISNGLPATYLGYFELATNGVLTYTAGPSSVVVTAPRIVSYAHNKSTNTIYFTTVSGGTYTLRGTNSTGLATAKTNWPAIGSSLAGNGLTNSLVEVTTNSLRLYIITAQ
jgi:hypothetical protein